MAYPIELKLSFIKCNSIGSMHGREMDNPFIVGIYNCILLQYIMCAYVCMWYDCDYRTISLCIVTYI